MRKRQKKKNQKKYIPIMVDEFNLIAMTPHERAAAIRSYQKFREKYLYCKTYAELKERRKSKGMLVYYYPSSYTIKEHIATISKRTRKNTASVELTQSLSDFM